MYDMSIFDKYINQMTNDKVVKLTKRCLENVPHDFWEMPASTTGKYHPGYALGYGGLIRHTLTAVYMAECLLNLKMFASLNEKKSEIFAALILHDSVKKGKSGGNYTVFEHPIYAGDFIERIGSELTKDTQDPQYLTLAEFIAKLVRSHMGQWNTSRYSDVVLPLPSCNVSKFVHLCDYLASRKGDDDVLSYLEN